MTPIHRFKHLSQGIILLFVTCLLISCNENTLVDSNKEIENHNWLYNNKIRIPVTITDAGKAYNLFMNLRHTANYKYSNIYVIIREIGPDKKTKAVRKEFQLAYPDGQWLGKGSGNLYSYQFQIFKNHHFSQKGNYLIEFEQNMRDNPLREVSDIGLKVVPTN
ncbi:gliding motility lipoprotein GldH [Pedobacter sp. HMF7647]|uniref:Gliding motility lipoprotein GldH n=1 Tax=Hufsiella arboris TaxID=2695275 RepID=A0A7K1Y5Z2_9SPHI|nr:gliding motility lipoprotein GldH [Hufsiella arboris]MXV49860.1 gliding motility lipoprotein GldH [Hufsiella arboris]